MMRTHIPRFRPIGQPILPRVVSGLLIVLSIYGLMVIAHTAGYRQGVTAKVPITAPPDCTKR